MRQWIITNPASYTADEPNGYFVVWSGHRSLGAAQAAHKLRLAGKTETNIRADGVIVEVEWDKNLRAGMTVPIGAAMI